MPSYNSDQLEEISSWIHDERRCVTAKSIALTLGVSRMVASKLLKDAVKENEEYDVTDCQWVEEIGDDGVKRTGEFGHGLYIFIILFDFIDSIRFIGISFFFLLQ